MHRCDLNNQLKFILTPPEEEERLGDADRRLSDLSTSVYPPNGARHCFICDGIPSGATCRLTLTALLEVRTEAVGDSLPTKHDVSWIRGMIWWLGLSLLLELMSAKVICNIPSNYYGRQLSVQLSAKSHLNPLKQPLQESAVISHTLVRVFVIISAVSELV